MEGAQDVLRRMADISATLHGHVVAHPLDDKNCGGRVPDECGCHAEPVHGVPDMTNLASLLLALGCSPSNPVPGGDTSGVDSGDAPPRYEAQPCDALSNGWVGSTAEDAVNAAVASELHEHDLLDFALLAFMDAEDADCPMFTQDEEGYLIEGGCTSEMAT